MHEYYNEDVAFERLKDLQREMENTRLTAAALAGLGHRIHELTARAAKSLAASVRQPARRPDHLQRRAPRG